MTKKGHLFLPILVLFMACNSSDKGSNEQNEGTATPVPVALNYQLVNIFPHDTGSYTQGLYYEGGNLLESSGLYGQSKIKWVNIIDGKTLKSVELPNNEFAEGLTILNNKAYQITWQSGKGYVYDLKDLKKTGEFKISTEGWGLTSDGKSLILSDGTNNLYFLNPDNYKIEKITGVYDNYGAVHNLNEMEYVDGYIYANRWQYNTIYKIDPESGKVVARLDLEGLLQKNLGSVAVNTGVDVLNGIAYNPERGTFYITGKNWPLLFEIKLL